MRSIYKVRFDPIKIIGHFGGDAKAIEALELAGMKVRRKTLQRQVERGNIPSDMLASLMMASVKAGKPIDIFSCLDKPKRKSLGKG